MATDTLLRDALAALKTKISSAAPTATPEELAFLGSAIDKIGGRATVMEVEVIGDIKKQEIIDLVNELSDMITDVIELKGSTTISAVNVAAASVITTKNTAVTDMNTARDSAVTTVNTARDAAIATTATSVAASRDAAIAAAAAAKNAVTQQLVLGAKAYYYAQI